MKKILVIKIGTNVLTRKRNRLDYNLIHDLVEQICRIDGGFKVVLVSSGAVGAGKCFGGDFSGKNPEIHRQVLASMGQPRLFQWYALFFEAHGKRIAQTLMSRNDFRMKESFFNIRNTFQALLANDVIPVINENDVVKSRLSTFGDNDQLAALTASQLEAERLILLSDVDGLYTSDPKTGDASIIENVERIDEKLYSLCRNTLSAGGSGGMFSKMKATEVATLHGIPVTLANGKSPDVIARILAGESIGTRFSASRKRKLSPRGAWMHLLADIKGLIVADEGAEKALRENRSLLAVGIRSLEGDFKAKEIVVIENRARRHDCRRRRQTGRFPVAKPHRGRNGEGSGRRPQKRPVHSVILRFVRFKRKTMTRKTTA